MKTKLLFICLFFLTNYNVFSQTDNWHQYTVLRKVNHIVKDASNNLHIATDIGYIKYNTTTNTVDKYFNITTQNPPIGVVRFVAVNPMNNDVVLGLPSSQGVAISNGTGLAKYTSSNSDLHSFVTPNVYYAKDGTLYIYEGQNFAESTKYQTFSNGIFSAVKTMSFSIHSIIENNDGTKIFFASESDGLYEFVKATSTLTNFTAANSDLVNDSVFTLFMDVNGKLHIGCNQGLNTLTSGGVWETFQEQIPNSTAFYSVFSIDQNTTGDLLLNNSAGFTIKKGYSILNPTTGVWTNYDPSTYCSTNADNLNQIVFVGDVLFANFLNFSEGDHKMWSFASGNNSCTEHNLNYLGVELFDGDGMYTVTLKENKNDNSKLDIGFVNYSTQSNTFKKMTIPINNFDGTFPPLETVFSNPNNGLPTLRTIIRLRDTYVAGEKGGLWFFEDGGPKTFVPHNIAGFEIQNIRKVATRNSTGSGTDDNKITIVLDGLDNNNATRVYKTECDILTNTCETFEELFIDRDLNEPSQYACTDDYADGEISCVNLSKLNNVVQFVVQGWDKNTNGTPTVKFTDDVTALGAFIFNDIHFMDIWSAVVAGYRPSPRPCFREDTGATNSYTYKCRKDDGTYSTTELDVNDDGDGDEVIELEKNGQGVNALSFMDLFKLAFDSIDGSIGSSLAGFTATISNSGGKGLNSNITYTVLSDVTLTLPSDFNMYGNPVVILPYSDTHFAMVLNSNYGLLIKTAIDYSSLSLDVKDQIFNNEISKIYPNPTTDNVTIAGTDIKNVIVFDVKGRKVLNSTSSEFSVKGLAKGIYIVKITKKDNSIISKKLIKN